MRSPLAGVTVLAALLALASVAPAETLRFALPTFGAYVDSSGVGCEASPDAVGELAQVQLWRLGLAVPEQVHAAGAAGAGDSFVVTPGDDEQVTYWVTTTRPSGVISCPSRLVTLNGRLAGDGPPARAWLGVPRPNPTHGLVAVSVCLPEAGRASLEVFDVGGRRVASLLRGVSPAGVHVVLWDARRAAPGVYLIVARLDGWQSARRVLVLR